MKQTIDNSDFRRAFTDYGRTENFSNAGLDLLFDYFESLEQDSGDEIELDVIAICCEYNEDSFLDVARNYDIDIADCEDDDEIRDMVLDYLNDNTSVVGNTDDSVVYACF